MAETNIRSNGSSTPAQCAFRDKTASSSVSLRRCAKCQTTQYCSCGCQKADWTQHKKPNSYAGFHRFLEEIEGQKRELLPSWWSKEKALECQRVGRLYGCYSLNCAIEKGDVIEHYGDPMFPMQLRMFAEQIYRTGPGGQSGSAMLQMQMMAEGGGVHTAHIDRSRFM